LIEDAGLMRLRIVSSRSVFASVSLAALARCVAFALPLLAACNKAAPEPPSTAPESSAAPVASAAAVEAPPSVTAPPPEAPPQPNAIPAPADVAKAPADAKTTASGLVTKVLTPGKGKDHPGPTDRVKVDYTGWTTDGKMFDSSVARGTPTTFGVGEVIPGWTEALKLMVPGEKRRLWIPGKLAYGDKPQMGGTPTGNLVFDVELLEIVKPPTVPDDVKAPPKTAKKTASGLYYRVLTPGTGKVHPTATSRVTVHYSGWTTDGKMFDSSVARGQPTTFPLNGVVKGWTEGVQLMVVGEKTRFWIPPDLAYGDKPQRPGAPSGELVFDIELLNIQ
jgi:FKBP-type peptidyl-prolyl cis-trans isomerase